MPRKHLRNKDSRLEEIGDRKTIHLVTPDQLKNERDKQTNLGGFLDDNFTDELDASRLRQDKFVALASGAVEEVEKIIVGQSEILSKELLLIQEKFNNGEFTKNEAVVRLLMIAEQMITDVEAFNQFIIGDLKEAIDLTFADTYTLTELLLKEYTLVYLKNNAAYTDLIGGFHSVVPGTLVNQSSLQIDGEDGLLSFQIYTDKLPLEGSIVTTIDIPRLTWTLDGVPINSFKAKDIIGKYLGLTDGEGGGLSDFLEQMEAAEKERQLTFRERQYLDYVETDDISEIRIIGLEHIGLDVEEQWLKNNLAQEVTLDNIEAIASLSEVITEDIMEKQTISLEDSMAEMLKGYTIDEEIEEDLKIELKDEIEETLVENITLPKRKKVKIKEVIDLGIDKRTGTTRVALILPPKLKKTQLKAVAFDRKAARKQSRAKRNRSFEKRRLRQ